MDEIIALKNKYMKVTDIQLKELLHKQIKSIDHVKDKHSQYCSEDELKIEELLSKVTCMKEDLESEKQTLKHKNHELSQHLDYITGLKTEKNKFLEENQLLESQRNKLKACKRNLHDQELLDQGRKKYTLYMELTRIQWDFKNLKESVEGNVSNKKDYIHHFCYKSESTNNLTDLLWQEIYQSTVHAKDKNVSNKENVIINN